MLRSRAYLLSLGLLAFTPDENGAAGGGAPPAGDAKPVDAPAADKPADKPVDPPADKPADKPADPPAEKPADDKPADKPDDKPAASGPPEKYDLKLPEHSTLEPSVLERTAATARELGLSNEAAQKLVDSVAQEVAAREDAQAKVVDQLGEQWKKETLADLRLGKTPEERSAAVNAGHAVVEKYATTDPAAGKALKEFLNDSALGNHPTVNHFFAWLGRVAGEGKIVNPPAGGERTRKTNEEVFYSGKPATAE